jgi:uncharacterized membrane protein YfhO
MLVLDDQYHPGWQARVDGKPVPVQRVNQFMRGVLLPAGEHQVEFIFAPLSVKLGLGLSLSGVFLVAALIIVSRRTPVQIDGPDHTGPANADISSA